MEETSTLIGRYAPDFELPGTDDNVHHLARYLETFQAVGVVFMGNHCPYVRSYLERLKTIQATFQEQGFTLVGINPNDATQHPDESFENMKLFSAEHQLNFPYLRDVAQDVARGFKAERTPEAFLIDRNSVVCYSGSIDDQPENEALVQSHYLKDAIAQLLKGETVTLALTEVVGCSIKWRS